VLFLALIVALVRVSAWPNSGQEGQTKPYRLRNWGTSPIAQRPWNQIPGECCKFGMDILHSFSGLSLDGK
jgi:hypothetical protein